MKMKSILSVCIALVLTCSAAVPAADSKTETTTEIANPWTDMKEKELEKVSGVTFGKPEGAENIIYRWMESEKLAEMQFTIDKDEYCARIQPAALKKGELMNISGIYYKWEHEEPITVGHCDGTIAMSQADSEDWVELCLWYDIVPGLMYSLSVVTTETDGLDLTAVAEQVYGVNQESQG